MKSQTEAKVGEVEVGLRAQRRPRRQNISIVESSARSRGTARDVARRSRRSKPQAQNARRGIGSED